MPVNNLQIQCGGPSQSWPPNPSSGDSNEMILEYFRLCFSATYQYPLNSREIQSLEFAFNGTGIDLYLATKNALVDYIGNENVGLIMYNRLRRSFYSYYHNILQTYDFFTPSQHEAKASLSSSSPSDDQTPTLPSTEQSPGALAEAVGLRRRKLRGVK